MASPLAAPMGRSPLHGPGGRSVACRCLRTIPPPRELPRGTFWLSREASCDDIVYGESFVLQRPRTGGPGLVLSDRRRSLVAREAEKPAKLAAAARHVSGPPAVVGGSLWDVTDVTAYTVLDRAGLLPGGRAPFLLPGGAASLSPPPPLAASGCTGMVLHPAFARAPQEAPLPDRNPRRTQRVRFTCKLCERASTVRVSPRGWRAGSVFAKCSGCGVVHKLVDNLRLFHDFQGPIFPCPPPANLRIPSGLPQRPGMSRHVHPAVWPHLPAEE